MPWDANISDPLLLGFYGCDIDNETFTSVTLEHPEARHLSISNTEVDSAAFTQLGVMSELRLLGLDSRETVARFSVDEVVFDFVARNSTLTHLGMFGCVFNLGTKEPSTPKPSLTAMWLDESVCDDCRLEEILSRIDVAKALSLRGCSITNASVELLSKSSLLERLHIERTRIDDGCVDALLRMKSLQKLGIEGSGMTAPAIAHTQEVIRLQARS